MRRLIFFIATCAGLGCSPKAPGTVGSLAALPLAFLVMKQAVWLQVLLLLCLLILSYLSAMYYGRMLGNADHRSIVCDEVCGLLPVLMCVDIQHWLLAFILFRVFDIFKPWPIRWMDQNIKGAFGCMLDDIAAGCATYFVLFLLLSQQFIG